MSHAVMSTLMLNQVEMLLKRLITETQKFEVEKTSM